MSKETGLVIVGCGFFSGLGMAELLSFQGYNIYLSSLLATLWVLAAIRGLTRIRIRLHPHKMKDD